MKIKISKKPRKFSVQDVTITDYGKIFIDSNQMISFVTKSKKKYDFTCKEWGFYISPSINSRLKKEGFKIAQVKNKKGKFYLMAVEREKKSSFKSYCFDQQLKILKWL